MNSNFERLEARLAESLNAWRRSQWQRGLSILITGFLLLAAFVYLVEPRWPLLWWSVLLVLAVAWLLALGKYAVLPLLRRPTLQQVARYFEEHHPELEDRLATALEVGQNAPALVDEKMLQRLLRDAAQHTQQMDFAQQLRVQLAQFWRVLLYAAAALLVLAIVGYSGLFRTRLASYFTPRAQTRAPLKNLQVHPGNVHVARGTTVEVIAEAPETSATEATLYLAQSGEEWQPAAMTLATQPGKFTHQIFAVRDTTRYYVRVGEMLSAIFALVPLDAPEVKQLHVTYHYSKKLGLPTRREETTGDIYAPIGTLIDLQVLATQALTKAEWRLNEGEYEPMQLLADTLAQVNFKIEKDAYYVVRLTNRDGLSNSPVEYYIHATPDEAPQVTLLEPGGDLRPTMLEEVTVKISVSEDYGLQALTMVMAHNNGAPMRHDLLPTLTQSKRERTQRMEYQGEKTLYLEDLSVKPGDFISYYLEAEDAQQKVATDLYFLEVRPFEGEFLRALSQGGGGENASELSLSEKEIITATWKLAQGRVKISAEELQRSSKAIAETQEGLRESIANMAESARLRNNIPGESGTGNIAQHLETAAQAMAEAVPLLENAKPEAALAPEYRAYHALLQAEAEIRQREITQGGNASAAAQAQSQEELSRLFQEELDKLQSKYETLQSKQQQQHEAQLNEAQEKVRELAQRQERLVDLNRQIARERQPQEEQRRQLQRLMREQDEIQRELQTLAQQLQRAQSRANTAAPQQLAENMQEATQDLQRAQDELRRNNPAQAAAEGNRALESLQRLEEQLTRRSTGSLRDELNDLHAEFDDLAEKQNALQQNSQQASANATARQNLQREQEQLRRRSEQALERLQQAQSGADANPEQQNAKQELRKLTQELRQRDLLQRMTEAEQALEQNDLGRAIKQQLAAEQSLRRAAAGVQESLTQIVESPQEQLDLALNETQRLRQNLEESWQRTQTQNEKSTGAQPAGAAPNQESAQGSATANPQGAPQSNAPSTQRLNPDKLDWWNERMWENLRQLEHVRPLVESDSALKREYNALLDGFRGTVRSFRGGDPQRLRNIESALFTPLRRFEAELATRVAVLQQQERLLNVRDERVPPQYREMVEAYFKKLAQSKPEAQAQRPR